MRGQTTAFFLFDVAESIDLDRMAALMKGATAPARFAPKPAVPAYVRYQQPPLQLEAEALSLGPIDQWQARFKAFDYGVVSVSLAQPFSGDWPALVSLSSRLTSDGSLEQAAERYCRALLDRIRPALTRPRDRFLSEDYFVFALTELDEPLSADALLARDADRIAQLLRGEPEPLSAQERDEIVRHRLSYLATDLVIPTWSTALVWDTAAGVHAALEIFEYANSQLLQFRYYDELLDEQLAHDARVQELAAEALHARRSPGARALHRRQRAHGSNGERVEAGGRRLRRAPPGTGALAPGRDPLARLGARQAEDARRDLPLRRGPDRHGARGAPRARDRAHPHLRAGVVLHGDYDVG
jgi:hypothetical protein